jgi:hypothetical protein
MTKKTWKVDLTRCPFCKLGTLFDVTSRLAQAIDVKHVECDVCGQKLAFKIKEKEYV